MARLRTITVANLGWANGESRPKSGASSCRNPIGVPGSGTAWLCPSFRPENKRRCSTQRRRVGDAFAVLLGRQRTARCEESSPPTRLESWLSTSDGHASPPKRTAQTQHYRGNEMMAAQLRSSPQWGRPAVIGSRCMRVPLVAANQGGATDSSRTFSHGPPSPLSLARQIHTCAIAQQVWACRLHSTASCKPKSTATSTASTGCHCDAFPLFPDPTVHRSMSVSAPPVLLCAAVTQP
ncbi:hypothetical protein BKA66DRAFT_240759 [Pyrenochaeta sp. MPI-SDFR-AT-0127]|nr:hypothetical protein BKA66DRAFT_240759 [Pyrenochaeta sp. MPI-SDFR-AT-0127]